MPYAIYPSIGFARVGNSPDGYFVGPESGGSPGVEFQPDGSEGPVVRFKDAAFRMKRQAARFRIFDISNPAAPVEAQLPAGSVVRWTVTLANQKDAVHRPGSPSAVPIAVQVDPARIDRVIMAIGAIHGASAAPVSLDGSYRGTPVNLGELRTDTGQRLVVLGGAGHSATLAVPPAPIGGDFYNNPDWFDDVGDGPVQAVVEVPGLPAETAKAAWVIVGPPDFAPPSRGIVTLYDMVRQVAIDQGWAPNPVPPSFESDIRPMIERAFTLQFVDPSAAWLKVSQDWARLADPSPVNRPLREQTVALVREVENVLHDFELRAWQNAALDAWAAGGFTPGSTPDRGLCDVLTRSALEGTLGQGFFPGIEAGINMTNPANYDVAFEFRFTAGALNPGDMTALMAQPWQADFLKCGMGWWPAQRPYRVQQAGGASKPWLRPVMNHAQLVANAMKLGVVTTVAGGGAVEQDRDPSLGP